MPKTASNGARKLTVRSPAARQARTAATTSGVADEVDESSSMARGEATKRIGAVGETAPVRGDRRRRDRDLNSGACLRVDQSKVAAQVGLHLLA